MDTKVTGRGNVSIIREDWKDCSQTELEKEEEQILSQCQLRVQNETTRVTHPFQGYKLCSSKGSFVNMSTPSTHNSLRSILCYSPTNTFQVVSFLQVSPSKPCVHFYSPPRVPQDQTSYLAPYS